MNTVQNKTDFTIELIPGEWIVKLFDFNSYSVYLKLRRPRDSNPRYGFPYIHFPGVPLQPLEQVSEGVAKIGIKFYQLSICSFTTLSVTDLSIGLVLQSGSYLTNQEIQRLRLNRISQGCRTIRKTAFAISQPIKRLSSTEMPMVKNQTIKVTPLKKTVKA